MKKIVYDKLIRDKIPEIIKATGKDFKIEKMNQEEHLKYLNKKLQEELDEYYVDFEVEELCDLVEVIYGILSLNEISVEEFHSMRTKKNDERWTGENVIKLLDVSEIK